MSFCVGGNVSDIFGTPSSKFEYQILKMWPGMLDYMADARQRLGKA